MDVARDSQSITLPDDDGGLICAFELSPVSSIGRDFFRRAEPAGATWLHFNSTDTRARHWLERADIPDFAREVFVEREPHVQLQASPEGVVAVLRDLHHDFRHDPEGFGTLCVFFDDRRMISARRHPLRTADHLRRELMHGLDVASPVTLFQHLIESLASTFAEVVTELADGIDDAEDRILDGRFQGEGKRLGPTRRLMVRLRRQITANRSALSLLPARLPSFCDAEHRQSLRDAIERFDGVVQDLELAQERARLLQEEIAGRLGEATNRNLFLLSVVTVVFLPITLISGIFGMNVGGLPGLEHPRGFWWVLGGMVVTLVFAFGLMRWRRVL